MAEIEQRKKSIAKEFIKNNVLNKELIEIQWELNSLEKEIKSWDIFNFNKKILWSELEWENNNWIEEEKIFWLDNIMKILFNDKWKQRTKLWYEANKLINFTYLIISDEWKKNLDLLYESLQKSKTEQELKDSLNIELSQLQNNVVWSWDILDNWNNWNQWNNWNENLWSSIWWSENLSSIENKEKHQVSEQYIYKQAKLYWVTDNRQIAYILAIVKWECWFKNIKEIWWENRKYWQIDSSTWKAYYGRWFLQLTHKWNYEKYTKIIRDSKLKFRDNNWNVITWDRLDLVKNPDTVLESNDLASFILIDWMKNWWPYRQDSKKLSHYINGNKMDYFNARYIINWDKNYVRNWKKVWDMYKEYAQDYLWKIWSWTTPERHNENNILTEWSPELLAKKNTELWWLWNSMMTGFQWYKNKTKFPNMDWVEWKNTKTHPRRFNSKQDVINYKNNHSEVKSFMFYFWANTQNNNQTLSDIRQRSKWMQEVWIQPVLCTCIWEDNHTRLTELNEKIKQMWKENNRPVLDFAKEYNNWQIAMWNNKHPTGVWYNKMSDLINESLA